MSMSYWMCEGIGINTYDIQEYLNKEKCMAIIKEQLPDEELPPFAEFDIDDYMYGEPFENMGDFLCHCDDTSTLTYGDNNDGAIYFYYTPSYPWNRAENEPKSIEDVHNRLIDAIQKICDLSREEIDRLIDDDIYDLGCG